MDKKTEKRPALVFVHGASHGAWCWKNYEEYFTARGWECESFDLPGHAPGDDPAGINDYHLQDYFDKTEAVLRKYAGNAVLIGHSMGGAIAQYFLAEHEELLRGAVLVSSGPNSEWKDGADPDAVDALTLKAEYMKEMMTSPDPITQEKKKAFLTTGRMVKEGPVCSAEEIRQSAYFNGRISGTEALQYQKLLTRESETALSEVRPMVLDLSHVTVPVLLVGSRGDTIGTEQIQEVMAASMHGELFMMHDAAHDIMLDPDWEESAAAIERFLANRFA